MEVAQRAEGIQPQHQKAGIGRDDQIAVLSPLEGQSGASVGFIAIAEPGVEGVKGTLGDAPGAARADTMLLHIEAEAAALIQETSPLIGKKELRHAVFEHGARPTGQTPIAVLLELAPAQPGPVPLRHVALGDGQETGQHGLTGHQVVPATPAPFFHRIVADIKQVACLVKEQRKAHGPQQLIDAFGLLDLAPGRQRLPQSEERGIEVPAVHSGEIGRRQGLETLGVVPVEEVPPMPGELLQRVQTVGDQRRCLRFLQQLHLHTAGQGQQGQTDVGGGGPMGEAHRRLLLKVVRGQVVIPDRHGVPVVLQRLPGRLAQIGPFRCREARLGIGGKSQRISQQRGKKPA